MPVPPRMEDTQTVTVAMVRFISGPVAKKTAGAIPLETVRGILRGIGWGVEEATLARPLCTADTLAPLERRWAKVTGKRPDLRARGKKAVEIGQMDRETAERLITVVRGAKPLDPTDLPLGTLYAGALGMVVAEWGSTLTATPLLRSERAAVVTAPNGTRGYLWVGDAQEAAKGGATIPKDAGFWKFAFAAGFAEAASKLTENLDPLTAAEAASKGPRTLDGTGQCQWCEATQKLRDGVLVDHGYTYPSSEGWRGGYLGHRAGSCVGVGWRPYEKSCDLLVARLPALQRSLTAAEAAVAAAKALLAAREVILTIPATKYAKEKVLTPLATYRDGTVHDSYEWTGEAKSRVWSAEQNEKSLSQFIANVEHRIANWKDRPLYDEMVAARAAR